MKSFPSWRVNSICGNLNAMSHRSDRYPELPLRISWGRCMEANCKMMVTILRQNELQNPVDLKGWTDRRIACCKDLESFTSTEQGAWDPVIDRVRLKLQYQPIRDSLISPFSMRAYLETARLQYRIRESYNGKPKQAIDFKQKAEWECRRIRRGYNPQGNRQPFSFWDLTFRLIKRKLILKREEWNRLAHNLSTTINRRGVNNGTI